MQLVYNSFRVSICIFLFKLTAATCEGDYKLLLICTIFQGVGQLWLYLLASQGYCVVSVDSRGSHHRGVQFESHIRRRMVSNFVRHITYINYKLFH